MTVFVYVNTSKQVGDAEHIKVFANQDAAVAEAMATACLSSGRVIVSRLMARLSRYPLLGTSAMAGPARGRILNAKSSVSTSAYRPG
jgi:hypothetical protein